MPGREESLRNSYGSGGISLLQHSVDFGYVFLRSHAARLISKLMHGEHRFRADFLIAGQLLTLGSGLARFSRSFIETTFPCSSVMLSSPPWTAEEAYELFRKNHGADRRTDR